MDFEKLLSSQKCSKCGGSGVYLVGKGMNLTQVDCQCKYSKEVELKARTLTDQWLKEYIPNRWYRETDFNAQILQSSSTIINPNAPSFISYSMKLSTIIKMVQKNRTPNHSYFISAPKGYGKKHFVYTLMREMYKIGLNVSPLYPLWQMRDVWVSADRTKEIAKMLEGIDVIFFTVSKMVVDKDLYFLDWLLYECELKGIAVILISRFDRDKLVHPKLDIVITDKVERSGAYGEMEHINVNSYE